MSDETHDVPTKRRPFRWWILVLIAIGIAAPIVWHKQIRFRVSPKNLGVVEDGMIYRGGDQYIHILRDICEENEIRTIIDLSGQDPEEDALANELGITRYAFELPGDGRGDPTVWPAVLELLADDAMHPIFVHCAAGAQRTTTAVMLFRKNVQGVAFGESYPESFDFKHKPDEWKLLSYLADHGDAIRDSWERGFVERDGEQISIEALLDEARTAAPADGA